MTEYLSTDPNEGAEEDFVQGPGAPPAGEDGWARAREILSQSMRLTPQQMLEQGPSAMGAASPEVLKENLKAGATGALIGTGIMAAPAGMAAIAPHLPRIGGAISGGTQGYKRGGLPGALIGAATGAAVPSIAAAGGAVEGYQQAGVPGALAGYVMSGGKGAGKLVEAGKAAARVLGGAEAAGKVAAPAARAVSKIISHSPAPGTVASEESFKAAFMARRAAQEAKLASEAASKVGAATKIAKAAPSTVVTKPPSELMAEAQKFESQIVNLRTTHGQSGAQIVNALKREHGISPGKGQKMVNAVLETHGLKKIPIEEAKIITTGGADPVTKSAMAFARDAVKSGQASGGNIHVLIENGQPVKVLTSAQAGAATRAGKEVTWIKNMWGSR